MAYQTYLATRTFPREEMFGITAQLRRSALSVPTNIVEGYGRQGKKELKHFANVALGSLAEARYLLDFSARLEYVNAEQHKKLQDLGEEVGRLLWGSINPYYRNEPETNILTLAPCTLMLLCSCDLCS
ncbi:MAG: four helix bundle protein [Sedimentisphaerales bacterium]|nr:four helix bundle protein [Sedimentisphaerales bacterium]